MRQHNIFCESPYSHVLCKIFLQHTYLTAWRDLNDNTGWCQTKIPAKMNRQPLNRFNLLYPVNIVVVLWITSFTCFNQSIFSLTENLDKPLFLLVSQTRIIRDGKVF